MNPTRVDLAFGGGLLVVVAAAVFLVYMPQMRRIRAAEARARELRQALAKTDQVAMDEQQIEETIKQINQHLKNFDTRLPSAAEIDQFLEQISAIAAKHHISLDLVKPGDITVRPLYADLPISIEGSCRFPDLYQLLKDINQMPRLTKVKDLRFQARPDNAPSKVEMTLLIFLCRRGV